MRRFQTQIPYLATLAESYHALRPLRIVLSTPSRPLRRFLHKLCKPVACRVFPARVGPERLPEQIAADRADLAAEIQTQMNAVATDNTYTVTYSPTTHRFTIARATGTASFGLEWSTGANAAASIGLWRTLSAAVATKWTPRRP